MWCEWCKVNWWIMSWVKNVEEVKPNIFSFNYIISQNVSFNQTFLCFSSFSAKCTILTQSLTVTQFSVNPEVLQKLWSQVLVEAELWTGQVGTVKIQWPGQKLNKSLKSRKKINNNMDVNNICKVIILITIDLQV